LAVIQEANKVVELNYSRAANAEAYSFTGWAHYLLAREKKSSYVNAMTALSKAIMNEPKSEWAHRLLGVVYADSARIATSKENRASLYENARVSLERAVEYDSSNFWTYSQLAVICHDYVKPSNNTLELAYQYCKKAQSLSPDDHSTRMNLVEASFTVGRYSEATGLGGEILFSRDCTKLDSLHMEFFITSSLFLENNIESGNRHLQEFRRICESLPKDFQDASWVYTGTRHYIESLRETDRRKICLAMLDRLEGKITLQELKERLPM
jgi:tetratricopeptide (TPR) repeat protein